MFSTSTKLSTFGLELQFSGVARMATITLLANITIHTKTTNVVLGLIAFKMYFNGNIIIKIVVNKVI